MKTLITIFTLILTWVFNAVANNNEPINPSSSFYLDAETIPYLYIFFGNCSSVNRRHIVKQCAKQ